jgi:hypothetical protein
MEKCNSNELEVIASEDVHAREAEIADVRAEIAKKMEHGEEYDGLMERYSSLTRYKIRE